MNDKEEIRSDETPERDLCDIINEIKVTIDKIAEILESFK